MNMLILFGLMISVGIISDIPDFVMFKTKRVIFLSLLIVPLLGWYHVCFTREDKHNIKKLKAIYNKYVGSLTAEEENAIKNFLLKDCSIDEFNGSDEILKSLELKQIVYKSSKIYRMEPWAFDYFHVYKLNTEIANLSNIDVIKL